MSMHNVQALLQELLSYKVTEKSGTQEACDHPFCRNLLLVRAVPQKFRGAGNADPRPSSPCHCVCDRVPAIVAARIMSLDAIVSSFPKGGGGPIESCRTPSLP